MALPVGETPVLEGEAAARFIKELHSNADKPVRAISTPALNKAHKSIKEYAKSREK